MNVLGQLREAPTSEDGLQAGCPIGFHKRLLSAAKTKEPFVLFNDQG